MPENSIPYYLVNAQLTKNINKFSIYIGCENILDERQENPIISAENPFGKYFDTSNTYGPTKGREIYIGLTFIPN